MLSDGPDLTRELDAAEEIVMGRVETVVTEWGVRRRDNGNDVGCANEYLARLNAAGKNDASLLVGTVIRRTVTYGPWEEVSGEQPAP
jgi:hypothetical protein